MKKLLLSEKVNKKHNSLQFVSGYYIFVCIKKLNSFSHIVSEDKMLTVHLSLLASLFWVFLVVFFWGGRGPFL